MVQLASKEERRNGEGWYTGFIDVMITFGDEGRKSEHRGEEWRSKETSEVN